MNSSIGLVVFDELEKVAEYVVYLFVPSVGAEADRLHVDSFSAVCVRGPLDAETVVSPPRVFCTVETEERVGWEGPTDTSTLRQKLDDLEVVVALVDLDTNAQKTGDCEKKQSIDEKE